MLPKHLLSREEYEELFPGQVYPKRTSAVAGELRSRGFDVQVNTLDQLVRRERVWGPPVGEGGNRLWSQSDVDKAAVHLESIGYDITPSASAALIHGYSRADEIRSQRSAFDANPDLPSDPSYYVVTIIPGAVGVGVPATIAHRRMTAEEEQSRRDRIVKAKGGER